MPLDVARRKLEVFARFEVRGENVALLSEAIDLHESARISFWDALLIRSAIVAGCNAFYSEDLQHSQRFEGVEIVNPFR